MTADWTTEAKGTGRYAEVNGINLYYEIHGAGRPLVLLHGGLGSGEMFGPVLPQLSEHHQVVAPDLQGHGRTADIDRPLDIRLMADDVAALIDHLGFDKPDVVGYSLGGGVALQVAVRPRTRSAGWWRSQRTSGEMRSRRRCLRSRARLVRQQSTS
jgi:pimeloyl-ACP methyl ester carboxylesterase